MLKETQNWSKVVSKLLLYCVLGIAVCTLLLRYSMENKQHVESSMGKSMSERLLNLKSRYEDLKRFASNALSNNATTNQVDPKLWKSSQELTTCKPTTSLLFAKTHKTGSSTLQNIFLRYGWAHRLSFVVPYARTWMFSFKQPFTTELARPFPYWNKNNTFNMFLFHSIWNYSEVRKLVPEGPVVTILRDPIDVFESGYVYMGLEKAYRMDINKYAITRAISRAKRNPLSVFGKNQLLWDLGLPVESMNNLAAVKRKVAELDKQFDLVLIAERFDESLLLLQSLLCWQVTDITYLKLNERKQSSKSVITLKTRYLLKQWLWADYVLYDHFKEKLDKRLSQISTEAFQSRINAFHATNKQLHSKCVLVKGDNKFLTGKYKMALPIVLGYVVDESKPGCDLYAISEPNFAFLIHDRQRSQVSLRRKVRNAIEHMLDMVGIA